jgi:hypothetical protein
VLASVRISSFSFAALVVPLGLPLGLGRSIVGRVGPCSLCLLEAGAWVGGLIVLLDCTTCQGRCASVVLALAGGALDARKGFGSSTTIGGLY